MNFGTIINNVNRIRINKKIKNVKKTLNHGNLTQNVIKIKLNITLKL